MMVGDRIDKMTVEEHCELCDTVIVWRGDDGARLRFTAHTPEYCKDVTISRIGLLRRMIRDEVAERETAKRQCVALVRINDELRDGLRRVVSLATTHRPEDRQEILEIAKLARSR